MSEATTIGLDIAKQIFHAHGADAAGRAVFSRKISRGKLLDFFAGHPRCAVALEACGGAHHWARELQAMGHEVRLAARCQRQVKLCAVMPLGGATASPGGESSWQR